MYKCKFCNKECSVKSYRNHEVRCKNNPSRIDPATWATGNRKGQRSWNSGLSGDSRCKTATPDARLKMSVAAKVRNQNESEITKQKRKDTIAKKVINKEWHTSLARHMHIEYNGIDLHGSWELAYVKYLDRAQIAWQRNTESFAYFYDGKERRYTPDFYLPATDEYIEIKGYKTSKDDAKWSQFPKSKTLRILMHNDLKQLKIIP